ncbi:hypothetical protein ATG66_0739 [Vibrio sp. ES.051]|uniref:hypothetical protein n=1 Tax=Vibrio sp. ES.051 TaxID=1761909 RepID=UPI000BF71319|nr:hypothetical protein [Vibrio sp. ES.051]PFG58198.1 hypothetical protein ATG66_0739 [Vibrio sp. ES.051]
MWIKRLMCIAWSSLVLSSFPSALACEASSLSIQPVSAQSQYDVFNAGTFATISTYRISANIIGEQCKLNLVLQLDDTSRSLKGSAQDKLTFEWSGQFGTSVANQWHLSLTDSQPSATVQMRFPSKQWLTSGTYRGLLEVYGNNQIEISPSSLPVAVNVPPAAKIHFYGLQQQHYDLDLGTLYSNKIINSSPNLWVQSNTAYTVVVESSHQGMLRHESNDPKWDIPYQLSLDNDRVSLKQLDARIQRHAATVGQPISLSFVVGETVNKPGGRYDDTLQISIEPRLSQQP